MTGKATLWDKIMQLVQSRSRPDAKAGVCGREFERKADDWHVQASTIRTRVRELVRQGRLASYRAIPPDSKKKLKHYCLPEDLAVCSGASPRRRVSEPSTPIGSAGDAVGDGPSVTSFGRSPAPGGTHPAGGVADSSSTDLIAAEKKPGQQLLAGGRYNRDTDPHQQTPIGSAARGRRR